MKIRLNLSTRPDENNRPFLATVAFVGTLGLLAFVVLAHSAEVAWLANRELRREISRSQADIRANEQTQKQVQEYFKSGHAKEILDRANFLNSLIAERSFPWTGIFMDLEKSLPQGVRVVSITPKLVNGRAQLVLKVGAASDESKIKFLQVMETSPTFSGLVVNQESHSEDAAAPDKIILDVTVWYTTA